MTPQKTKYKDQNGEPIYIGDTLKMMVLNENMLDDQTDINQWETSEEENVWFSDLEQEPMIFGAFLKDICGECTKTDGFYPHINNVV